jgi:lysine-N-methylase
MPAITGQRWACHSCGNCCRSLVGHLFEADRRRIDDQAWEQELGVPPYVRMGSEWVLNKTADDACVFLDENNRCRIHSKFGEAAKPVACRIFPFSVRPTRRGWQVSFRFDCPSAAASKGKPIGQYARWLHDLVQEIPIVGPPDSDSAKLTPRLAATEREIDALSALVARHLKSGEGPILGRCLQLAWLTSTLHQARLANVRGGRFVELLDILALAMSSECQETPPETTRRPRGMLRQIVFAHAEHASHAEARARGVARFAQRWRQLRVARRFWRGRGRVPSLRGFDGSPSVTFAQVEAVSFTESHRAEIENLLERYVVARLEGRSCFGAGYFGWPVLTGIGALWLTIPTAGWLARYHTALAGRMALDFDDFAYALGIVDRAATRLPAVGSYAEQLRVAYLYRSDAAVRLIRHFAPIRCGDEADSNGTRGADRAHDPEAGSHARTN